MTFGETPEVTVRRLGLNTIAQVIGVLAGTLLGFATFLVVTRGLGPSAFGDLVASQIYLLIPVALADLGLSTSVVREISVHPERSEHALRASLPLRALVAAVALGAAVGISFVLPFSDRARLAIWVGSIGSFFTLLNLGLVPLFQVRLRMHVVTVAALIGRTLTFGVTAAAIASDRGFTSVVLASVLGLFATFVVDLVVIARSISLRPIVDGAYWKELARDSVVIGSALATMLSYYRIDTVLVALVRGSREVGLYGAAFKFVEIAEYLIATIGTSVFPSFTRLAAAGDVRIRSAVQRSVEVATAVGLPLTLLLMLMPREIIELAAGPRFAPAAEALRLLAPYLLLLSVSGLLLRVLGAAHRDRYLLGLALTVLILNVGLNLALLPSYGYKVAAVTSTLSEAVVVVAATYVVRRRFHFLPYTSYLGVLAAAGAVMVGVFFVFPGNRYLAACVATAVYAATLIVVPGAVRDVFRALAHRRVAGRDATP